MSVARCSFLVLGEDSGEGAHETLVALAKNIFRLVDSNYDWQHIRFEPPEDGNLRLVLRGNEWKNRNHPKRRDLMGYIATKLLEGDRAFVIYHIDGDRRWAERETSENVEKFRDFIEIDVRRFIEHRRQRSGRAAAGELALSQLLLLVPYYSIEAWLFQNTRAGIRLCEETPACRGKHVDIFRAWADDRSALDDVWQPKEQICFKSRHNRQLAESLDVETVYYAGQSLHHAVDALHQNASLLAALAATRPA
ncbi:hypothetical protein BE21_00780 [Sorangium cellulosum]|uniref:DUF4276 family protein n=1 Tax=Sorangium cellulosum TaxID=56 RepID=A0A150U3B6_SORCE|nr:hypothetical protein BE21_00780 [Sorangium cellulosum]